MAAKRAVKLKTILPAVVLPKPLSTMDRLRMCENEVYRKILYTVFIGSDPAWYTLLLRALYADVERDGKPLTNEALVILGLEYRGRVLETVLVEKMLLALEEARRQGGKEEKKGKRRRKGKK